MASNNLTVSEDHPEWNSQPMFQLPSWGEPLVRTDTSNPSYTIQIPFQCANMDTNSDRVINTCLLDGNDQEEALQNLWVPQHPISICP